jgi:hypothetical protein
MAKTLTQRAADKLRPTPAQWQRYRELLEKDSPKAADEVATIAAELGIDADGIEVHRLVLAEHARLAGVAAERDARAAARDAAYAEESAAKTAMADAREACAKRIAAAVIAVGQAQALFNEATDAERTVDALQATWPALFGQHDRKPLKPADVQLPASLDNLLFEQTKRKQPRRA